MKTFTHKLKVLFIFFSLISGSSFTPIHAKGALPQGTSALPSLDWQRVNLEQQITKKVERSLAPILKSNDFVVDVEVINTVPEKPKFKPEPKPFDPNAKDPNDPNALNEDNPEDEEKPEDEKPENEKDKDKDDKDKAKQEPLIKLNDKYPDEVPEDYVLFSKLGLEAPLIDDFNDFKEDAAGQTQITIKGNDGKVKKVNIPKKAEEFPVLEQLYNYNQSLDIFKNLESVTVFVKLNERLLPSTRDSVESILRSLKFNLNEVQPKFDIQYINMLETLEDLPKEPEEIDEAANELPKSIKEIIELVSKFDTVIAALLGIMLLAIFSFVLFRQYARLQEELADQASAATAAAAAPLLDSKEEKEDEDDDDKDVVGAGGAGGPGEQQAGIYDGIERFKVLLEKSPVEASILVKRWIQSGEKEDGNALKALVQQLDNIYLSKIFENLNKDEKSDWKSLLDKPLAQDKLLSSNMYISNQIVEEIMIPSAVSDPELGDILLKITPEQSAAFIQDQPELGKILLNVMSTKYVAKILEHLDNEFVDEVIESGLSFEDSYLKEKMPDFKSQIAGYYSASKKVPFADKIKELIPVAMGSREGALFAALARSNGASEVVPLAEKYFPSCLVSHLPAPFLKALLQQYPAEDRAQMLYTVEEKVMEKLVSIFAPVGSKANDMLQLEFEKYEGDAGLQARLKDTSDELWSNFVKFTRRVLANDTQFARDVQTLVTNWANNLENGVDPESAAESAANTEATQSNEAVAS